MSEERLIDGTTYVVKEIEGEGRCLVPVREVFKITPDDMGRIFLLNGRKRAVFVDSIHTRYIVLGGDGSGWDVCHSGNDLEIISCFYKECVWAVGHSKGDLR